MSEGLDYDRQNPFKRPTLDTIQIS